VTEKLAAGARLFGNFTRTGVLIALAVLEESYPHELARLLERSLSTVQSAVDALEREGIVATRRPGIERRVVLDRRFFAATQLRALLLELARGQPALIERIRSLRRRPRRRGKPL
jgi:DNA-binding transcriptional ArsR family regulator